ncbi:MAG: MurT ligase domain-containing protein [Candidatus Melainabacteria bacterium]|nr:MurT ligase domain-containing protein [Candidatus Melainabacteria bacterium]
MASGLVAISLAKLTRSLVKILRLGSGSALPGRVALALQPKLLEDFAAELETSNLQSIITGTNGKTTTAGLLREIYKLAGGEDPISNLMGANLYYGILAEFINSSDLSGNLKSNNFVLEVDEATLPEVAKIIPVKTITVTNLFRDQLDRFGEIDATQKLIIQGIRNLVQRQGDRDVADAPHDDSPVLVLNADDTKVLDIANQVEGFEVFSFAVKADRELSNLDSDPQRDVDANLICEQVSEHKIKLVYQEQSIEIDFKLPGLYNIYNATAAAATALVAGVDLTSIKQGIENYRGNFGRAEIKTFDGVEYQTFLIKNPTGATEVLRDLATKKNPKFMIAINDNYADGRDLSWLWDAEFEHLQTKSEIICAGCRAEDMAVRLKYAGIKPGQIKIIKSLKQALVDATSSKQNSETLFVLPTYTALLELNQL